eukprot:403341132
MALGHIFRGPHKQPITAEMYGPAANAQIKDLDALTIQYFNNICQQHGRQNNCWDWLDMKGERDHNWPFRKTEVIDVSKLLYQVKQKIEKPSLVLSQDYCNSLKKDGSFDFKKSTSTSSTCSWSVTEGLQYQSGISATVGVPAFASTTFSEQITLSFSSTQSQEVAHVDTWEISTTVPVEAQTYVNATYTVIESDFDTTWTADLTIRGCANIWFHDKLDDHWEWWHGVADMYSNVPGFTCWVAPDDGSDYCLLQYCKYQASGIYYGIGGAAAHLDTDSKPCIKQESHHSFLE